jgi:hypothetical protein
LKLTDIILFGLAVSFLFIGVHQGIKVGWAEAYWLFMLSTACLFLYGYRKNATKK